MFTTIIRNGMLIDGTGAKMKQADLAIEEGKIMEVGNLKNAKASNDVDAAGNYIVPGFVDINSHADGYYTLFTFPTMDSLAHQGVTTVITGNCGTSCAPLVQDNVAESLQKWANIEDLNFDWVTFKEFFQALRRRGLSCNFASLCGHETLRRAAVGATRRTPLDEEMQKMENLLKKSLGEGVLGFSSGLAYAPANVASIKELTSLVKISASMNGYYATHLRSESAESEEALAEAIQIAKEAKIPLHIAHFKVKEKKNWQKWPRMLDQVNQGLSSGLNVTFDIYPYTVASVVLSTYLPDWVLDGGKIRMLDRLKDKSLTRRITEEMKMRDHDFSPMRIAKSFNHPEFVNKGILDLSSSYNLPPEEIIIEIIKATEGNVMCFYDVIFEENLFATIKHPQCMISTSGGVYSTRLKEEGNVHPRNFGTFPKFLKEFVLEKKLLTLEEAIKKITHLPAKFAGLKNRGTIKKGNFADIVVFNPLTLSDRASFEDPYQYPLGIELVLVNGEAVIISGQHTQDFPGKILKR